jgi:hypothetical protein
MLIEFYQLIFYGRQCLHRLNNKLYLCHNHSIMSTYSNTYFYFYYYFGTKKGIV